MSIPFSESTVDTSNTRAWNTQAPHLTAIDARDRFAWSVFPLDAGKQPPVIPGLYHPDGNPKRLSWKKYQSQLAHPNQINAWQSQYQPAAWAIITGSLTGRIILDFDGEKGNRLLEQLGIEPHVQTGSGGHHIHFVHPSWRVKTRNSKTDQELAERYPGLDIRADGGYAVFCGNNTSGQYIWLREPDAYDLDILPEDFRDFLGLLHAPQASAPIQLVTPTAQAKNKKSKATKSLADTILDKYVDKAYSIGRDNACFDMACQLRDNNLSRTEAESIARSFANRVPSTNTKGQHELFTEQEALVKVASAYDGGTARQPWTDLRTDNHATGPEANGKYNDTGDNGQINLCKFSADDAGNGDALYALHGKEFLYCYELGWMYYDQTHWKLDKDGSRVKRKAVETLRKRRHAAVDYEKEEIIKCCKADDRRINGCINRFRTLVNVEIDQFDNSPDFLNCKNGVLDMRNDVLEPHCLEQRFTYCVPVAYRETYSEEYEEYLRTVVGGGQEVIDYLQMAAGYSLTGHTSEECLFYLFGPTRAGKGTFAELFQCLLPEPISKMVDFNTFTAKREGDTSNFDLAPLKPARMIFASESQKTQSLNPAKIKQITGGDQVTACFKHKDFFSYRPQFKVWMLSNHKANGDPEDDALWGRVRVIEFPNSFLGKEDKTKKERLKSPEILEAVLYWAVQGARKWYALGPQGLTTPESVAKTTQAHRDELDYVQQWLDENFDRREEAWIPFEMVMKNHTEWCAENNVYPKGRKNLTQSLQYKGIKTGVLGYDPITGKRGRGYLGLRLKDQEQGAHPEDQTQTPRTFSKNEMFQTGSKNEMFHPNEAALEAALDSNGTFGNISNRESSENKIHEAKTPFEMFPNVPTSSATAPEAKAAAFDRNVPKCSNKDKNLNANSVASNKAESINEKARAFYEMFTAQPGYHLRIREDGTIGIGVPAEMSEDEFKEIAELVDILKDELLEILQSQPCTEPEDNTLPEVNPFYREAGEDYEEGYI